jgi:hypothetical protein
MDKLIIVIVIVVFLLLLTTNKQSGGFSMGLLERPEHLIQGRAKRVEKETAKKILDITETPTETPVNLSKMSFMEKMEYKLEQKTNELKAKTNELTNKALNNKYIKQLDNIANNSLDKITGNEIKRSTYFSSNTYYSIKDENNQIGIVNCGEKCIEGILIDKYNETSEKQKIFKYIEQKNNVSKFEVNGQVMNIVFDNIEGNLYHILDDKDNYIKLDNQSYENYNFLPVSDIKEASKFVVEVYKPKSLFKEDTEYVFLSDVNFQMAPSDKTLIFYSADKLPKKHIYFKIKNPKFNKKLLVSEYEIENSRYSHKFIITQRDLNKYSLQYGSTFPENLHLRYVRNLNISNGQHIVSSHASEFDLYEINDTATCATNSKPYKRYSKFNPYATAQEAANAEDLKDFICCNSSLVPEIRYDYNKNTNSYNAYIYCNDLSTSSPLQLSNKPVEFDYETIKNMTDLLKTTDLVQNKILPNENEVSTTITNFPIDNIKILNVPTRMPTSKPISLPLKQTRKPSLNNVPKSTSDTTRQISAEFKRKKTESDKLMKEKQNKLQKEAEERKRKENKLKKEQMRKEADRMRKESGKISAATYENLELVKESNPDYGYTLMTGWELPIKKNPICIVDPEMNCPPCNIKNKNVVNYLHINRKNMNNKNNKNTYQPVISDKNGTFNPKEITKGDLQYQPLMDEVIKDRFYKDWNKESLDDIPKCLECPPCDDEYNLSTVKWK